MVTPSFSDSSTFRERGLGEVAGGGIGVASGANGLRQVNDGVTVTIKEYVEDFDIVAGGFTFAPSAIAGAAVEGGQSGESREGW